MSKPEIMTLECAGCTAPLSEAIVSTGVYRCPYCGYVNILPKEEQSPEVKHYLYNGDAELKDYAFERAYNAYSKAVELDPKESKAYFGMALSSNRVKYIKDVVNNRWQAICCEVTDRKFCEDVNYLRALEVATDEQKVEYEARAKEIDYIREKFLELKNSGLSYDTFLCVKVSDGEGGFTTDSHWAGKLYDALKKSGASPFYSEKEIGDRVGEDYEALILYALYTSKSMVIVCSNEEYLRTPWVQNEYTRYYSMMTNEEKAKNSIMIAFFDHVVEHIPTIPGKIQGVNLLGFGGLEQITEFVSKHANAEERARKKAEEKARAEAERKAKEEADRKAIEDQRIALKKAEEERKAKEEADEKARQEQQKAIEEQQRMLLDLQEKLKKEQEDVKYCVKCGAKNPSKVKFCSECASSTFSKANEKFCVSCETVNPISTKFCSSCGKNEFVFAREEIEKVIAQRKAKEEAERIAREKAEEKRRAREEAKSAVEGENADSTPSKKPLLFILIALFAVIAVVAAVLLPKLFDDNSEEPQDATTSSESPPTSEFEYTVSDGKVTITDYTGTDTEVVIPSTIEGYPVTSIGYEAFKDCSELESIVIPNGVTSIGYYAFRDCTKLESITIPDSVTSIGISAFYGCSSLTSITIPNGVTAIGNFAFYGCSSLTSIIIPNSVTKIGSSAFYDCTSLASVTIPNGVTTIGYEAFRGCKALTSIIIPDSVITIGYAAFKGCTSLTSITISDSVTAIGDYAFQSCTSLTSITIPDSATAIGDYAFKGCTSLASVTIPDSVTKIGISAFYNCSKLISIIIPDSVTTIGEYAFSSCYSLTIYCEAESQPSGWDSNWNSSNRPVEWGYEEGTEQTSEFKYTVSDGKVTITDYIGTSTVVEIPSTIEGYPVTAIGSHAFAYCTSLTSVEIPNSVTTIGDDAFAYCTSLESIFIPNSVTYIAWDVFDGCSNLTIYCEAQSESSGWHSDWNPSSRPVVWGYEEGKHQTSELEYTVSGGKITITGYIGSLTEIAIPSTINSLPVTSIGEDAFYDCTSLTSVTIPDSVTTIGSQAFLGCTSLTSITIPNSVKTIGEAAFASCTSLKSITVDGNNTAYKSVDGNLYTKDGKTLVQYATGKPETSFAIPSGVTTIGEGALAGCASLTSVTIPDSVTTIGECAFIGCASLTSITIPNEVTTIGFAAFADCESLTSIVIPNSVETIENYAFDGCTSLTIYCEAKSWPSGWDSSWDFDTIISAHRNVVWDYIGKTGTTADGVKYKYISGGVEITGYTGSSIEIAIPSTIGGLPVTSIGSQAFYESTSLESIVIPNSVTSIGDHAFRGCYSLASVTIPNGVTSIGSSVFRDCTSLASITIPDSVTTIRDYAFQNCTLLASITIPNGVTSIGGYAFAYCTKLESITIPNGVTAIGSDAFSGCTSLEIVNYLGTVEQWCTISFENINANPLSYEADLYFDGALVTSLEIPSTVTEIKDNAFTGCTSITSVEISNGATAIGESAFTYCTALTSVTVPGSVKIIGSAAFGGCESLTSVVLEEGIEEIQNAAFAETAIENLVIPDGVKTIYPVIVTGCVNLKNIYIPETVITISGPLCNAGDGLTATVYCEISSQPSGWTSGWNDSCSVVWGYKQPTDASAFEYTVSGGKVTITKYVGTDTEVIIPSKIEGYPVTTIGASAFYDCDLIESVTIPDSITTIGNYAFCECASLKSMIVGNNNTAYKSVDGNLYTKDRKTLVQYATGKAETSFAIPSGVTTIGAGAFIGSNNLTSVEIPYGVTLIENAAFNGCKLLESVVISNSVTTIGTAVFCNCTSLENVVIPNSVTTIGIGAFSACTSLKSVFIPDSVTEIGLEAFGDCGELTIYCEAGSQPDDWNTDWNYSSTSRERSSVKWGYNSTPASAFTYTVSGGKATITKYVGTDTKVVIPFLIEGYPVTAIGSQAFWECTSLESVVIPSSVTSIGNDAFLECTSLESVVIPSSVTEIGACAFEGCTSLASITIPNSVTTIGNCAFDGCDSLKSIFIPNSVTTVGAHAFVGCDSITIYCEAKSRPNDWDGEWDWSYQSGISVVWGHSHSYTSGKCVCGKSQN